MKGKIKEIKNGGVFGFIEGEDGKRYFYHISKAEKKGWKKRDLQLGMMLEFIPEKTPKGLGVKEFISEKTRLASSQSAEDSVIENRNLLRYDSNDRNFYLFLNKPYHVLEHGNMYSQKGSGDAGFSLSTRFSKDNQFKALKDFDFKGIDCSAITKKQRANIESLFSKANTKTLLFKPDWRMTLGLGGASVFETDITLHHIYGVPYIPATSVKGVVRSYIIQEQFDNDEAKAILDKNFCDAFGCSKEHEIHTKDENGKLIKNKKPSWYGQEYEARKIKYYDRKGAIYFFDALPTDSNEIEVSMDIMNVHYKDYYDASKKKDGTYQAGSVKPPADWSSPTIINFLTVEKTTFQFLLASKDGIINALKIGDKLIEEWFNEALTNHGIGAKTAVGYGYMEE
ncbi:MAG: type III-B CRISPR module RAMP protein Cmr6 [Bacteroidota bacterium]